MIATLRASFVVVVVFAGCSSSSSTGRGDGGTDGATDQGVDQGAHDCMSSCTGIAVDDGGGSPGNDSSFTERSCTCGSPKSGAGEGAACTSASDCAGTCCACATCGGRSFQAAACVDGKCASAGDACSAGLAQQAMGELCP